MYWCSLFLHKLEVDLGLEDQIKFILLFARENVPLFAQEDVDLARHRISALKEGIDDRDAIGSYRLISEADSVAGYAIDEYLTFCRQSLAQIELLAFEGILRRDHGEADRRRLRDGHRVCALEVQNQLT
jgi:hypothetical protein